MGFPWIIGKLILRERGSGKPASLNIKSKELELQSALQRFPICDMNVKEVFNIYYEFIPLSSACVGFATKDYINKRSDAAPTAGAALGLYYEVQDSNFVSCRAADTHIVYCESERDSTSRTLILKFLSSPLSRHEAFITAAAPRDSY